MSPTVLGFLALALSLQAAVPDRSRAEQLAREGHAAEALEIFQRIVDRDATDIESRLWVARLYLRLGRIEEAEAGFRSVTLERPADVDAQIGLASVLLRRGAWLDALSLLREAEPSAGDNSDFFAVLARAYRRAGDDAAALEYFRRARALAPADPDIVAGYEDTVRVHGHSIAFDGFSESGPAEAVSGSLGLSIRVLPRLHLQAAARAQDRSGSSEWTAGGGALWRASRVTTVDVRALAGPGNTSLPVSDVNGTVIRYLGVFEIGGSLRQLSFSTVDVLAASPLLSIDPGTWRLDSRYTYSRSWFDASGESAGDHSAMVRGTVRPWRRFWLNATYAYGIESFETLTADRIDALGASTAAAGFRIAAPSHTAVYGTWEHQWRSNNTSIDRFTVSIVQSIP